MKTMPRAYQNLIMIALAVLMAVGSITNAVAGAISCLPKACCCTAKATDAMGHTGRMEMETQRKCTPRGPAPCCHVEPFEPKTDLAISSQSITQRINFVHMIANDTAIIPEQINSAAFKSILDTGPLLKIPLVPIYLQTLSILC